jgi:alpha-beta hydrolase superfamily lysophospholipase
VLLLHGINQTAWSWEELALALSEHGHYVVGVECRGHGDSHWAPAPKDYSCATVAADIRLVRSTRRCHPASS